MSLSFFLHVVLRIKTMANQYALESGDVIDLDTIECVGHNQGREGRGNEKFVVYFGSGRELPVYETKMRDHLIRCWRQSGLYGKEHIETMILDLLIRAKPDVTYICPSQAIRVIEEVLDGNT